MLNAKYAVILCVSRCVLVVILVNREEISFGDLIITRYKKRTSDKKRTFFVMPNFFYRVHFLSRASFVFGSSTVRSRDN